MRTLFPGECGIPRILCITLLSTLVGEGRLLAASENGPTITSVVLNGITKTGARLFWDTSEPIQSAALLYGTTNEYGQISQVQIGHGPAIHVSWFLSGLRPSTTYHVCPSSVNGDGQASICDGTTNDFTFTTLPATQAPDDPIPPQPVDTSLPLQTGRTWNIPANNCNDPQSGLQVTLDNAQLGDTIVIPAGTECIGTYIFPNKTSGSGWIVVRTSTPDSQLPLATRVTPSKASLLATIEPSRIAPMQFNGLAGGKPSGCTPGTLWWNAVSSTFDLAQCNSDGASYTQLIPTVGDTLPATCTVGQWFQLATAPLLTSGHWCISPNHYANIDMTYNGGTEQTAALQLGNGAHHYRFIGINVAPLPTPVAETGYWDLQQSLIATDATTHDITFDRMYIHGLDYPHRVWFGIKLAGSNMAIIDSWLDKLNRAADAENEVNTMAVYLSQNAGPGKITNNYINAIGISLFFSDEGGIDSTYHDFTISGNTFYKGDKYRLGSPSSDGHFYYNRHHLELKHGVRFAITNNIFQAGFANKNQGAAIMLTPRPSDVTYPIPGATNNPYNTTQVADILIENNLIDRSPTGIVITGHQDTSYNNDGGQLLVTQRVKINNNIFRRIDGNLTSDPTMVTPSGNVLQISMAPEDVKITHNTVYRNTGPAPYFLWFEDGDPKGSGLLVRDNIYYSVSNSGGLTASGSPGGTYALDEAWGGCDTAWEFDHNFALGDSFPVWTYPPENVFETNEADFAFANAVTGDFRLRSNSVYKGMASDGSDPGVNYATFPLIYTDSSAQGILAAGQYYGPVTITLTPALSPASVTITYYQIDNGPLMSYTGSFQITGIGIHTLTYFSVNSAGQSEDSKTMTISIRTNTAGFEYVPMNSCQVFDTRSTGGELGNWEVRTFSPSNSICGIPTSAVAYSLDVIAEPKAPLGNLSILTTGSPWPSVLTFNSTDGRTKSNSAIVPAGTPGEELSVRADQGTDVQVSVNGYFVEKGQSALGLSFYPVAPCRLIDTRDSNLSMGRSYVRAGTTLSFAVTASNCGIPANAQAYVINTTAYPRQEGSNEVTVWPAGAKQPLNPTLVSNDGVPVAVPTIVRAGTWGRLSAQPSKDADIAIDITGYFAPPSSDGLYYFPTTRCSASNSGTVFVGALDINLVGPDSACDSSELGTSSLSRYVVVNATEVPMLSSSPTTLFASDEQRPSSAMLTSFDGNIPSSMAILPVEGNKVHVSASNPISILLDISGYFAPAK